MSHPQVRFPSLDCSKHNLPVVHSARSHEINEELTPSFAAV